MASVNYACELKYVWAYVGQLLYETVAYSAQRIYIAGHDVWTWNIQKLYGFNILNISCNR
jgi:hypothetical protein